MAATERREAPRQPLQGTARALLPLGFWAVALTAAATVVTERALPLALVAAVAALALRWLAAGAPSARTPLDLPIAGLALLAAASAALTPAPATTLPQVARLLVGFGLFYAVANWARSDVRRRLATLGLALAGLALAAGALVSVRWETYKFPFLPPELYADIQPRVTDYVNPNVMAGYLALLLPCVAAPLLFAWRRLRRPARALGLVVLPAMAAVLLLTQSRAGLLAAAAGALALALARWWRAEAAVALIAALAAAALVAPWLGGAALAGGAVLNGPQRAEVYVNALAMARDHWALGVGMGTFEQLLNARYPLTLQPEGVPHAHNLPLQVAIDLGLPGLVAWAWAAAAATLAAWRGFGQGAARGDRLAAGLAAGLLGAQAALLAHGALDAVTWGMVRPAVLVWGLWGLAVALAAPAAED